MNLTGNLQAQVSEITVSQAKECIFYKKKSIRLDSIVNEYESKTIPELELQLYIKDTILIEKDIRLDLLIQEKYLSEKQLKEEKAYFEFEIKKKRRQRNLFAGISLFLASLLIIK